MSEHTPCGCRLASRYIEAYQARSESTIEYCPLHKAAPEMLDILKMLYTYARTFAPSWSEVERARNIIAKAEGEP